MSTKAELLLLVVDQTQIKLINPAQKIPSHTNFTWSFSNVSLRISVFVDNDSDKSWLFIREEFCCPKIIIDFNLMLSQSSWLVGGVLCDGLGETR